MTTKFLSTPTQRVRGILGIKAAENDPSDSYVDTGWIVKTAAKAGDVVEIQKL